MTPIHVLRLSRWLLVAAGVGAGAIAAKRALGKAGGAGVPSSHASVPGPAGALHVDDGGNGGLPVVFVHGFAGSSVHWQRQLEHLRTRRRALALDLRGHGRSDAPRDDDWSLPSQASDIAAVVDTLALPRFVLVGHSMGGAAAAAYAGREPQRVAGLVLVGAPGRSSAEQAGKIMDALRADYAKVMSRYWVTLLQGARSSVRKQLEAEARSVARADALAMIEATFAHDPLPALAAYRGPTLLVDTEHGDGPDALHRQAPQIERRLLGASSHWPQLDQPRQFNRLLDEFLARCA
jgi:pimeloyl-ACP methyl ester carboxylesterase